MRTLAGKVALLLGAVWLTACGLGAGPAPSAVQLTVSRDFGARALGRSGAPRVSGQETVMSLLRRNHSVATRYSGGFVQSVDGLAGGQEGGHPVDWFFYVNGVQALRGAASTSVRPGDHIWWDRHDWSQALDVPAVVGSFPEPFLNGLAGKRLPVRVECEAAAAAACGEVAARLHQVGVPAARAAPGAGAGPLTLRVLVGTWVHVRADPAAAKIAQGPRSSGVYARFSANGSALTLLDPDGRAARTLQGSAALVAATRNGEDAPVWILTGTDTAALALAARSLTPSALKDRFALALTPAGALPVPEAGR